MDFDELTSDILDALDGETAENVTTVTMGALLSALAEHMDESEALSLAKRCLAAASKAAVEDEDDEDDEE